jgi:hypothetical protein
MAISQAICNSFKQQLFEALHDFNNPGGDTFFLALYTSAASLDATTTTYTTGGEVSSTGTNYPAGGSALTSSNPVLSGSTAILNFANLTFPSVTLTARGCLIYNTTTTPSNAAVAVFDFGSDKTATDGDFTIIFPAATSTTAVIRLT